MINPQAMNIPQLGSQQYGGTQSMIPDGRQPFVWQPPLVQPGQFGQYGQQVHPGILQQITASEILNALPHILPYLVGVVSSIKQQTFGGQQGQFGQFGQQPQQGFGGQWGQTGQSGFGGHLGLYGQQGLLQQITASDILNALPHVLPYITTVISAIRQQSMGGQQGLIGQFGQQSQQGFGVQPGQMGVQGIGSQLGQLLGQLGQYGQQPQQGFGVQPGQFGQYSPQTQPIFAGQRM